MSSILQEWVTQLPIRYQGTLLAAIRGCDGVPKEDASKTIMRGIRNKVLNPADARELAYKGGFMSFNDGELTEAVEKFGKNMDHYPLHFVLHAMHAMEVIGYKHPVHKVRCEFQLAYMKLVHKMHLNPEQEWQLEERMLEDRIANGTV